MKQFIFKMYIKTSQGQEFLTGSKKITSNNYDEAKKIFNKLDLPFHHFSTVDLIKL